MKRKILYALLALVTLVAGAVVMDREIYRVHGVLVLGCQTRPPEEVTALSGIELGQRILEVDLGVVAESVNRSPYYRVDGVRRVYPDVIEVTVHERLPRAVVLHMGAYIVMDEEGYILEIRQDKGYAQCPMVSGVKIVTYNVGQRLDSSDSLQVRALERVVTALETLDIGQVVNQIFLDDPLDIRITTVDGYRVMCGDMDNLEQKFGWLSGALTQLRADGLFGGTIYLGANSATYAPYRESGGEGGEEPLWPDEIRPDAGQAQQEADDIQDGPEDGEPGLDQETQGEPDAASAEGTETTLES